MTFLFLHGRMGNNLFQIAFGQILKTNSKTLIFFIPKAKNGNSLRYFSNLHYRLFIYSPFTGKWFVKLLSKIVKLNSYDHMSCLNKIDTTLDFSNSILHGYYQNSIPLDNNKEMLNKFFKIRKKYIIEFKNKYGEFFISKKVLTIHIRLNDYLSVYYPEISSDAFVGIDWYLKAMRKINVLEFDNIFVISDDIILAEKLLNLEFTNVIYSSGNEILDFQILMNSDTSIISNSSFAWWSAFLNSKPNKVVYAPLNWVGYNVGIEYPAGIMTKQFKWI